MDIREIMTFKKVVETGSITAAANKLNYAQPTVTLHIHTLETELGVPLFNRIGRKLLLTDAGRELYECALDVKQLMNKISSIGISEGSQRGTLRIAAAPAIVRYRMGDMLLDYFSRHPQVDAQIINHHNAQKISELLSNGNVDFAILAGEWYNSDILRIETLEECDHVLVAGTELDISSINLTEPNKPLGCRIILNHYLSSSRHEIENYLSRLNIIAQGFIEVWNIEVIKQYVENNLGLALLPRFVVERELKAGKLLQVADPQMFNKYVINLAYRKSKWETPLLKEFRSALMEHFPQRV